MAGGNGVALTSFVDAAGRTPAIGRSTVAPGDLLMVRTRNSIYLIRRDADGQYLVSGGWFARKGVGMTRTTIAGCTAGGSMIWCDVIVARGLCIEFGNRLITSAVRSFVHVPCGGMN
jgi:hypothetical protein